MVPRGKRAALVGQHIRNLKQNEKKKKRSLVLTNGVCMTSVERERSTKHKAVFVTDTLGSSSADSSTR